MPGYGFSGKPTGTGWGPERMARAWAELMKRLSYTRYVAQANNPECQADDPGQALPERFLQYRQHLPGSLPRGIASTSHSTESLPGYRLL